MRLRRLSSLKPEPPEPGGTFAGWFIPRTPYLVDATAESIRVWDGARRVLAKSVTPPGRPHGAITLHPHGRRILTAHENAVKPFAGNSVVLWDVPELAPVAQRTGHAAIGPGISMGAQKKHFLSYSDEEASSKTPGLIVWDLELNAIARWKSSPQGEPLAIEDRRWIADARCRAGEAGVDIRNYEGRRVRSIAEDAPVTHQIRERENELWLFQEEGRLDIWDLERLTRTRVVDLGHAESMRDDFPQGAAVCVDDLDSQTTATLGTDGMVKFWRRPEWTCLLERPFEMAPTWIDVDRDRRLLAVGFRADGIELFAIV